MPKVAPVVDARVERMGHVLALHRHEVLGDEGHRFPGPEPLEARPQAARDRR